MKQPVATVLMVLAALGVRALAEDISTDTTWSGQKDIVGKVGVTRGTLTIQPGTKITFGEGSSLAVAGDGALIAQGTKDQPIEFTATHDGSIGGSGRLLLAHCRFNGLGKDDPKIKWLAYTAGGQGMSIRDGQFRDCSGMEIRGSGQAEIIRCDFRNARGGIRNTAKRVVIAENTILHEGLPPLEISGGSVESGEIRDNILINCTLSGFGAQKADEKSPAGESIIEHNYIHLPIAKGNYCIMYVGATIRNNILRGASWTAARITGDIVGNVFEAVPLAEARKLGTHNDNGTHEHICGLLPNARLHRNIFLHGSYGAIMGIGPATCDGAIITNNTFDMRGFGSAIFLNHLPNQDPKNIIIRNNIFMRSAHVDDERGITDSLKYFDYNLWVGEPKKGRFVKVTMTGKKPGDDGFGGRDIPTTGPTATVSALRPEDVVVNSEFEFPYTDQDLLERKYTVAQCLSLYRQAYIPKPGSPAIGAGDPADKDDPLAVNGRVDIGAVQH